MRSMKKKIISKIRPTQKEIIINQIQGFLARLNDLNDASVVFAKSNQSLFYSNYYNKNVSQASISNQTVLQFN